MNKDDKIRIFQELITQASSLRNGNRDSRPFIEWQEEIRIAVTRCCDNAEDKIASLRKIVYYQPIYYSGQVDRSHEFYVSGIEKTVGYLNSWLKEINVYEPENDDVTESEFIEFSYKCFIVHGHNTSLKYEVNEFLEEFSSDKPLTPIILHKKANEGKTVIEKFEKHSDVDFAVCIWSADDEGRSLKDAKSQKRARQNVVIETGFFWGKFGRERVIILLENDVEIPSDYKGMIYISLKDNWKDELRKEIKNIYD